MPSIGTYVEVQKASWRETPSKNPRNSQENALESAYLPSSSAKPCYLGSIFKKHVLGYIASFVTEKIMQQETW